MPRSHRGRRARSSRLSFQELEARLAFAGIDPILVPVGDVGNVPDRATGYGGVSEAFRIGKYEVTIGEYAAFLNAVAAEDPAGLYHEKMADDGTSAGISRTSTSAGFAYAVTGPAGITPPGATSAANRPISYVNWFDAARFANWMANGQPTGPQDRATTEDGAYDLTAVVAGTVPVRNTVNPNTGAAPTFFLPTENQWYKAAYYDPDLRRGRGGYYRFATRSDTTPGNVIGDAANQVNYIFSTGAMTVTQEPTIEATQNYLTNVGAMRSSRSSYGTFDQNGNVWELTESAGMTGGAVILRGGAWTSFASYLESGYRLGVMSTTAASNAGFRIAAASASAEPVVVDLVTVGNANNAADVTGFGAVASDYAIAKTGVTIGQYVTFLNAVARTDRHGLYNPAMATDLAVAGITRVGRPGRYAYSVMNNDGSAANRPITYVSWFDAARFANWIANGQPGGRQTARTTENGAYNLAKASGGRAVPRNAVNPNTRAAPTFFLPTENEWYKAAYFTPDKGGVPGYYLYATQQDDPPTNNPANGAPVVNYLQGVIYSVTQSPVFSTTQNYLTDVGAFATTTSFYGTLDQNGNVYEWNDLTGAAGKLRGLRGGFWAGGAVTLRATTFTQVTATREANDAGFRLVSAAVTRLREP
jgi:formylglycine-generating enzyme required for sulfatase activity